MIVSTGTGLEPSDHHERGCQLAIDAGQAAIDLKATYLPMPIVDEARLRLWERQLRLDLRSGSLGEIRGDRVVIAQIRARSGL